MQNMKKLLIVLGTILAATAGNIITSESKVSIMEDEQFQYEIAIEKDEKSENEEINLKKLMFYSYLLQISENNNGTKTCTFCEYLLLMYVYSVNDTITNSVTEENVKKFLGKICTMIPPSTKDGCQTFVNTYGGAIVDSLVQGIDPSLICPMMRICPSDASLNIWKNVPKRFFLIKNKPDCPFCLFLITQINDMKNKTKASIEAGLNKLRNEMPDGLINAYTYFMKSYSKDVIELILTGLSSEEVCNFIHLCNPTD